MHFWGGAIIGIGTQTGLYVKWSRIPPSSIWRTLAVVVFVGVSWEIFEWHAGISDVVTQYAMEIQNYYALFALDTGLDLICDIVGGVVGYGVARKLTTHLD